MAIQKTYSFYGEASVPLTSTAELLQFDIANDHIACSLINMGNQAIQAFEFFEWETGASTQDNNWVQLFSEAAAISELLQKPVSAVQVFINSASAVIVPLEKFNTEAATDYLQLLFGPAIEATLKHEKIKNTPLLFSYCLFVCSKEKSALLYAEKNIRNYNVAYFFTIIFSVI